MKIKRTFLIGSEWLYLKVYASHYVQQKLLREEIYNLASELYKGKYIEKFFFVIYEDVDGPHLRLRFLILGSDSYMFVISKINGLTRNYVEKRIIKKVVADTYIRELERYGRCNIENIETIFSINSWNTLSFLKNNPIFNEEVWLSATNIIDVQLSEIGKDLAQKQTFCSYVVSLLQHKLGVTGATKKYLQSIFKTYSKRSPSVIKNFDRAFPGTTCPPSVDLTRSIIDGMNDLQKRDMIIHIIHMAYNRLFPYGQNIYELLMYDYMNCYYKMKLNQSRQTASNESPKN